MQYNYYISEIENFPTQFINFIAKKEKKILNETKIKNKAEILFIRLKYKIDKKFLSDFDNLKVICTATTGITHICKELLEEKNIKLISLAGEENFLKDIKPTANLALSMILKAQSNILDSAISVYEGIFDRSNYFRKTFEDSIVGILGMGRLGILVSEYLIKLGFKVYYFDKKNIPCFNSKLIKCESINDLFLKCQIISIHINYEKHNDNLINRNLLSIKPPYKLINTSRGEIFRADEIEFCLKKNLLTSYFTDVLEDEPFKSKDGIKKSKIWNLQKRYGLNSIFITPHIGGACWTSLYKCETFIIQKLVKQLQ
ncbi:D-isomer specific 2-hydroxyacid dehydrogenase family protein [Prochlorococcus sp. MIT 0604]|uniref:NAD(P)-dependent oxidoreductase n=1 Tax=Prochlorococcus sp. MIT 0604 TaxID=1501268 RepID=UPI0004F6AE91|nr:NAD(P)-dependent oxidoreductase [Prochlorococcus sp. MIT 0604]AIQ95479.1 phosphoglycerate dehydrogenase [Prochlorococcus sp. MIT 0604]